MRGPTVTACVVEALLPLSLALHWMTVVPIPTVT
jgi:hypothetical protein